jgi:hypothetical protein
MRWAQRGVGAETRVELELDASQIALLDLWLSTQPLALDRAEAAKLLMFAVFFVHGSFTRTGRVGALWTGFGPAVKAQGGVAQFRLLGAEAARRIYRRQCGQPAALQG